MLCNLHAKCKKDVEGDFCKTAFKVLFCVDVFVVFFFFATV